MLQRKVTHEIKLPISLNHSRADCLWSGGQCFEAVLTIDKAIASETVSASEVRQIVQDCRVSKRGV